MSRQGKRVGSGGVPGRARLVCWVALLLPALGCGGEQDDRLSVLLITLDTTRVDALGAYGRRPSVTPALDRLAAEGVTYKWARTVSPTTLPAHASMLTGLYPPRHSVRVNASSPLPRAARTLAEQAQEGGYSTAAFVAASVLDGRFGLDQGFDVFDAPGRPADATRRHIPDRRAPEMAREVIEWIRARDDARPSFLWVHLFDPHEDYTPPPEILEAAQGNAYLGEVAVMDLGVALIVEELRRQGLLDRTLILAVADHGEGLGQHGEATHGTHCYDTTIRVPFMIRYPDGYRAGERSAEIVSVADVFPTLSEAMGLPEVANLDGESLYRREVSPERGVYFESYYGFLHHGWSPMAGWATRRSKYIHSARPEIYDPLADPSEAEERSDSSVAETARDAIARVHARRALEAEGLAEVGSELREEIRSLGYATVEREESLAFPDPLLETDRRSPHDSVDELRLLQEAWGLNARGERARAIPLLREIVSMNPGNSLALTELGYQLMLEERWSDAAPVLERALGLGYDRADVHQNLALCYANLERLDDAAQHYARAVELDPRNDRLRALLDDTLQRKGAKRP